MNKKQINIDGEAGQKHFEALKFDMGKSKNKKSTIGFNKFEPI